MRYGRLRPGPAGCLGPATLLPPRPRSCGGDFPGVMRGGGGRNVKRLSENGEIQTNKTQASVMWCERECVSVFVLLPAKWVFFSCGFSAKSTRKGVPPSSKCLRPMRPGARDPFPEATFEAPLVRMAQVSQVNSPSTTNPWSITAN